MVKRGERKVSGISKASRSGASQGNPPQAPSARRSALARAITPLVAIIAAIALSLALIWWVHTSPTALADGGGGGHFPPHPVWTCPDLGTIAGAPRRWEAGMGVGPYSQVNLRTGRVLTTLPIVGWSGKGPAVSFSLYHNMNSYWGPPDDYILEEVDPEPDPDPNPRGRTGDANDDGAVTEDDVAPFIDVMLDAAPTEDQVVRCDFDGDDQVTTDDLLQLIDLLDIQPTDPQWSHTYSRHLWIAPDGTKITLVWDDGTQDDFTYNAATDLWSAPPGVFLSLTVTPAPVVTYTFTSKSQDRMEFDADGKLEWLQDASGSQVTCAYIDDPNSLADGKLWKVTDASGRVLELTYNAYGKLKQVNDAIDRYWKLLYDGGETPDQEGPGQFVALADPMDHEQPPPQDLHRITWTYTREWNIGAICDKDGNAAATPYWHVLTYAPGRGRLQSVTDPAPLDDQTQAFHYYITTLGNYQNNYVDRRGSTWQAKFNTASNLIRWKDPLAHAQKLAYEDTRPALAHAPTKYTNALNAIWTTSYDARGNMLTTTDPLGNQTTRTYDSSNNLTSVTPPGDTGEAKRVIYTYNPSDPVHPTSPQSITLPAADQDGDPGEILFAYYGETAGDPATASGLLKSVTDANGVETLFTYDEWGQPASTVEGPIADSSTWRKVEEKRFFTNAIGWDGGSQRMESSGAQTGQRVSYCIPGCSDRNLNGAPKRTCCCCFLCCPGFPGNCNSPSTEGGVSCGAAAPGSGLVGPWGFPCYPPFPFADLREGPTNFTYDQTGRVTNLVSSYSDQSVQPSWGFNISATTGFDHLGRQVASSVTTDEPTFWNYNNIRGQSVVRDFTYTFDDPNGIVERTGPDGQVTHVQTDIAGRVDSITRTGLGDTSLSATYTYNADNSVAAITYGNAASSLYYYDAAGRVTDIAHYTAVGDLALWLNYSYSPDGLITTVSETDASWNTNTTTYGYDNRNRLVTEHREGSHEYWLEYSYDQGGNRTEKVDVLHNLKTEYHYDWESPTYYQTKNNRLMYYQVLDTAGSGNPVLLEEVKYYYGDDYWQDGRKSAPGSPTLIARKRTDENFYRGTLLTYNKQGELWMVAEHVWGVNEDGTPNCDANQRLRVREFGGSGRGRTMVRDRNPNDPGFILTNPLPLWSDYDGDTIYGDYTVTETGDEQSGYTMVLTEKTAYLPGIGQIDYSTTPVSVTYYHADHLGTLRATTDGTGALAAAMVYTAFGEVVATDGTIGGTATAGSRYQYAGDSGYESGLLAGSSDFPSQSWQHVGARWYDPSTGRFLQRDPIGIRGGLNVYEYVSSSPPLQADPQGLTSPLISITDNGRLIGNVTIINPPPGLPRVPWYVLPPGVGLSISCAIFVAQWTSAYIQDTSRALQHPDIFGYPPLPQWYEFWAWGIDDSHLRPGFVWPPPPKPKFDVRDCPIAGSHVCFEAGTWVETAQGGVAIESLEKGMTLMAARSAGLNVEEATLTWAGVSRYTDEVVVIALADEVIRCTRSHPFWVSGRGWVLASELTADDLLQDMQGDSVAVVGVSIDCLTRPTAVYNIKVSGPQCFFVGRHAVLVHTQCSVVPPR